MAAHTYGKASRDVVRALSGCVLVLGVEWAHPVEGRLTDLTELARAHGGAVASGDSGRDADAWRSALLRMPYVRDGLARMSAIAETFETACTWDRTLGSLAATVTHHHAVGRDHRPGYGRQRPERFAPALRAGKAALDPAGILDPGVLIGPV